MYFNLSDNWIHAKRK